DYATAYRRFRSIFDGDRPLNRRTTAAHLMAAKALYRDGQYQEAADLLETFVERFPTSGYLEEARLTIDAARYQLGQGGTLAQTLDLGIALPLGGDDTALTQALFNGIRLA